MPRSREQERARGQRRRNSDDNEYHLRERLRFQARRARLRVRTQSNNEDQPWWSCLTDRLRRSRWRPPTWDRSCNHCGASLLHGEPASMCCSLGTKMSPPLPALPHRIQNLASNPQTCGKLSTLSRKMNNLFSFSAIGVTGGFKRFEEGIASVAITGRTYHRLLDAATPDHSIHWFLYDELERERDGNTQRVPVAWTRAVKADLEDVNPYVRHLRAFQQHCTDAPSALATV